MLVSNARKSLCLGYVGVRDAQHVVEHHASVPSTALQYSSASRYAALRKPCRLAFCPETRVPAALAGALATVHGLTRSAVARAATA